MTRWVNSREKWEWKSYFTDVDVSYMCKYFLCARGYQWIISFDSQTSKGIVLLSILEMGKLMQKSYNLKVAGGANIWTSVWFWCLFSFHFLESKSHSQPRRLHYGCQSNVNGIFTASLCPILWLLSRSIWPSLNQMCASWVRAGATCGCLCIQV